MGVVSVFSIITLSTKEDYGTSKKWDQEGGYQKRPLECSVQWAFLGSELHECN